MPIAMPCPQCKAKLKGPDQLVGHTLKCPGCGTPVTITAAALVAAPKPPPPPPAASKPAGGAFPNMELDDVGFQDDPPPAAPPPLAAAKPAAQDAIAKQPSDDFEVLDDAEEEVWVDPLQDDGEELEVVDDDLPEVLAAEEEDELEVVESNRVTFRTLELPRLHVRSQSGMFAMTNAYDLVNPRNKKKIGEAVERPDGAQQVLGYFAGKNLMATKIEVTEGRNDDLVLTVRRGAYVLKARADIYDADDEKLGSFDILPFSALTGTPLWISDAKDRQIIKLEMKLFSGRRYFRNKKGDLLAEWVHETTYEKKLIKFKLAPRGNSFYLIFQEKLKEKPRERMLILGASLGLDLFQTAGQRRGPLGR